MYYTMTYKPDLLSATRLRTNCLATICLAALIWLAMLPAGLALESDRQQPIDVSADRSELDARTGFTHIIGSVVIKQGSLEVKADDAEVYVESGRVTRVLLKGQPATWKQQMDSLEWMDAEARQIDYKVNDATILLTGDALVNHPQGRITGDQLTYDLEAEKLRGDSVNGGRVKIRLEPDVVNQNASAVEDVMENVTGASSNQDGSTRADAEDDNGNDDGVAGNNDGDDNSSGDGGTY